jgi:gliding-associated putative ABC transporter substrate-binding component GldG
MNKRLQDIIQVLLILGVLIFINIIGNYFYTYLDLTEEKRYTLTAPTKKLLHNLDEVVFVQVLLDGDLPAADFKRLQKAVKELLKDFRSESKFIEYEFINPNRGSVEQINERRKKLAKDGIIPVNLVLEGIEGSKEQLIYPYATFTYKGRYTIVNFLEAERPGIPKPVLVNNSVALLEYKFANAIQKMQVDQKPNIGFLQGHGELARLQMLDFEKNLRQFYDTYYFSLDSLLQIPADEVNVLIVGKPRFTFPKQDQFKIDQYIMNGGKMLWLIDRLNVNIDSVDQNKRYVPLPYNLDLENLWFSYGIRINPSMVLDLECSAIPLKVGDAGGQPQFRAFPYFYHPVVAPKSDHPIVKSLDRVNLFFPSSIDTTIRTKTPIEKTVLLSSSAKSRVQLTPATLDFEMLRVPPQVEKFNQPFQPMAVLYEGVFTSAFENRVTESMMQGLQQLNMPFKTQSKPTSMIVVADGDIIRNDVRLNDQNQPYPLELGLNPFDKYIYANKSFLLNAVEFLLDKNGIIESRGKEIKLRLLDQTRATAEQTKWQFINIVVPLLLLLVFGLGYTWLRKRRFGQPQARKD